MLTKLVVQVGAQTAKAGSAVGDLVAPASVRSCGLVVVGIIHTPARIGVQHQRRDSEGVTVGVEQDGRQEVGGHGAAQLYRTKATRQGDIGVTREESFVVGAGAYVPTTRGAGVCAEESTQCKASLQTIAQVFRALDAPPRCGQAARTHLAGACTTGSLHGADIHVDQARQFYVALGVRSTQACQRGTQGDQSVFHGGIPQKVNS